jgi:hypothetical protein
MHFIVWRARQRNGLVAVSGVRIDHVEIPLTGVGGAVCEDDPSIRNP